VKDLRYYIRYADDFVFLNQDKEWLLSILPKVNAFLSDILSLTIHPDKLHLKTFASGVDFLGWVHFPDHKVLRTATKQRMFIKLKAESVHRKNSYLGMLSHGNAKKLQNRMGDTGAID
jgi:RNA-directed DNA polymerase